MAIDVTGYPSTTTQSFTTSATLESDELIQYLTIDVNDFPGDEYIEVEYNSQTITIYIVEECRYTPKKIHFINREGAEQVITFYKSCEETINVKSEVYETDSGQPSADFHQFREYNRNGRTTAKLSSGFMDEDQNDVMKQLMLSHKVWIEQDDSNALIPVNIKSSSLKYKNRQKDRLISYEIEIEFSYNEVNTI